MSEQVRLTPVEIFERRRAGRILLVLGIIAALLLLWAYWRFNPDSPVDYAKIEDHFKYGSIGGEPVNGIPIGILKALPIVFADKLPGPGYESLGFITEEGRDRPIGFSTRRVFFDRSAFNCSICHTGTVRDTPNSDPRIILGMPANTMNLQALSRFLVECALDERFTADQLMPVIERVSDLNFIERFLYRHFIIPRSRQGFIDQFNAIEFFDRQPGDWGPGRVDTFNPYKIREFNFPMDKVPYRETVGVSDLPSIWLQRDREGMNLHWDGNNASVEERNKSAALAIVTPPTLDLARLKRIEDWLWEFEPPEYPYEIDAQLADQGRPYYEQNCASCHGKDGRDFDGRDVGQVVPIDQIGTDRFRLDSYTRDVAANQNTLYAGYPYRFKQFKKTDGYANSPLDGIWLRAPYLHNGSVPTMRDLLEHPDNRPKVFYRGYDVYDRDNLGFISNIPEENGRRYFRFDTSLDGNGNQGHLYGIDLTPEQKSALIEYLKTF